MNSGRDWKSSTKATRCAGVGPMPGHASRIGRKQSKLGPKQQKAIEALLRPGTVEDAAREAGVPTKELSRWMKDPAFEFMAEYRAARRADCRQSMASVGL
jgi:hypothetical protein